MGQLSWCSFYCGMWPWGKAATRSSRTLWHGILGLPLTLTVNNHPKPPPQPPQHHHWPTYWKTLELQTNRCRGHSPKKHPADSAAAFYYSERRNWCMFLSTGSQWVFPQCVWVRSGLQFLQGKWRTCFKSKLKNNCW